MPYQKGLLFGYAGETSSNRNSNRAMDTIDERIPRELSPTPTTVFRPNPVRIRTPFIRTPIGVQPILRVTAHCEGSIPGLSRNVNGLLYRYNNREDVTIACLCHGVSFSPEGFLLHAGRTDTSNALGKIIVHSCVP